MRKIAPLLHIIKQLKGLGHEIDLKMARSSHKEGTRQILNFSVALPMFYKKLEIPKFETYATRLCLSAFFATITNPNWTPLPSDKSWEAYRWCLTNPSWSMVKYAGVEFAHSSSQWESKTC
jgi:hypothetical protein